MHVSPRGNVHDHGGVGGEIEERESMPVTVGFIEDPELNYRAAKVVDDVR